MTKLRRRTSCAGDGCYTFTIFDGFGDGICCYGSRILLTVDGALVAAGGEFGDSESTTFCVGSGFGCAQVLTCNYDPDATIGNGVCDFSCYGCTDPASCNYDPGATIDDGSCIGDGIPVTVSVTTDTWPGEDDLDAGRQRRHGLALGRSVHQLRHHG